jgi:predicted ArsR family transcriptional regulator
MTLQERARALGDPTRHAIFQRVAEADQPIGIAELNEAFALNHNAIRQHLAKLVAAGLVVESTAAGTGRGRPRLVYEVEPSIEWQWGTIGPYERLSRLLVEVVRTRLEPQAVGRQAADQFRVPSPSGDVVADISAAMARQGFDPEVRPVRGGAEVVLHRCPFVSSAVADRHTVCSLHLGIAEGLADGTSGIVEELVAYDPRMAECRLRISHDPSDPTTTGVLTLRGRTPKR